MLVPAISASGLRKSFTRSSRTFDVLLNFACDIDAGSITLVSGPNGIGKTVLARCLCGLEPLDSGAIRVFGQLMHDFSRTKAQQVGIDYVPQILPQPQTLTGFEFLALSYGRTNVFFRKRAIATAFDSVCREYQLEPNIQLGHFLVDLSLPDLQMLYIVRSLMHRSRILILDEPTAYLERSDTNRLQQILQNLSNAGVTVLVISHPEQAFFENSKCLTFSRSGFTEGHLGERENPFLPPEDRFTPRTTLWGPFSWPTEQPKAPFELQPGQITVVQGPTSCEFFAYERAFARSCTAMVCGKESTRDLAVRHIPFDARNSGLARDLDLLENSLIGHWGGAWNRWGIIDRKQAENAVLAPIVHKTALEPKDPFTLVKELSGGNSQRLIVGRALHGRVDILIGCNLFTGLDEEGVRRVGQLLDRTF